VIEAGRRRSFARGQIVFHQGEVGDSLHLIQSGRFTVRVGTPDGDVLALTVLGPGDSFGELALLDDNSERTATVAALEAAETLTLSRQPFLRLLEEHPGVARHLLGVVARNVLRDTSLLLDALFAPAERRVLRRLLDVARAYGDGERIPLTQVDLAELAGTSRSTVNRVLGDLREQGAVGLSRGGVTILDRASIEERAQTSN
jgi:CRP/FNR family cyclic AMP-dependent transcriptional regulator